MKTPRGTSMNPASPTRPFELTPLNLVDGDSTVVGQANANALERPRRFFEVDSALVVATDRTSRI